MRVAKFLGVLVAQAAIAMACGDDQRCETGEEIRSELNRIVAASEKATLTMSEVITFGWDRMYLFGAYTPVADVKQASGMSYKPSWWQDYHVPEARNLLVLVSETGPTCYVELPDGHADGAEWAFDDSAYHRHGTSRDEAAFVIDRTGNLPMVRLVGVPSSGERAE